ncbi:MAG: hypothetical protein N3A66_08500 [Planctomycetota bacterium]|nr:hypothetical protein [Planctomycetota bacterium]
MPAVKDNSIVIYPGEMHLNADSQPQIRIKGNQHIVAMAFDMSPVRGQRVTQAFLHCRQGAAEIKGLTISTIAVDWGEHKSSALTDGKQAFAGWGLPGVLFPAVCGGNSFTLVCQAQSVLENGWYRWEVAPDLVHACAAGLAWGLALHEHDCDYSRNPTIFSREAADSAPFLEVLLARQPEPQPQPPSALALENREHGVGLRLSLIHI